MLYTPVKNKFYTLKYVQAFHTVDLNSHFTADLVSQAMKTYSLNMISVYNKALLISRSWLTLSQTCEFSEW